MVHSRKVLANGLRVIAVPMPSMESATVLVMVGAGSRYESSKNSGISHFLEHMAFKGTDKRPTFLEISSEIDALGGESNAFTDKEITGYYIKSSKNTVETTIEILADLVQNSKLEEDEINKEKGVIIEEINMYQDNPMRYLPDVYQRLLYGDTPMGWDTTGDKDTIRKITRVDFKSYLDSLYSADNITVVIAGGVEKERVFELVEKYFRDMKKFETIKPLPLVEDQKKPQIMIKTKKTEQVHLALGVRTVSLLDPDKYSLELLSSILGGGMSSRLFSEVREKRGLAYYVRSMSDAFTDVGSLLASAGVDPSRVYEAIEVIVEHFAKLSQGKLDITEKELNKAREYVKGHFVLDLEDSRSVAAYYAQQEILENEVIDPDEEISRTDKVSLDDILRVGMKYFKPESLNLALIGNFEDGQKFESLLKF